MLGARSTSMMFRNTGDGDSGIRGCCFFFFHTVEDHAPGIPHRRFPDAGKRRSPFELPLWPGNCCVHDACIRFSQTLTHSIAVEQPYVNFDQALSHCRFFRDPRSPLPVRDSSSSVPWSGCVSGQPARYGNQHQRKKTLPQDSYGNLLLPGMWSRCQNGTGR